jgi:regulator of protease activity HflC (stomatin/prohibitin superfamily)
MGYACRRWKGIQHIPASRESFDAPRYIDPGVTGARFFLLRTIDAPVPVDMRTRTQALESLQCFTQEGVAVDICSFLLWKVVDPCPFLLKSPGRTNTPIALGQIAGQTLMNTVGQWTLAQVLRGRQKLSDELKQTLQNLPETTEWGIRVIEVGLSEIKLPPDVQEARARQMAASLIVDARTTEDVGTAKALAEMQKVLSNPEAVDRAVLLQLVRALSGAISQHK